MHRSVEESLRNSSPVHLQKSHTPEKDSKPPPTTGNGHVSQNNGQLSRLSSYSLEVKLEAVDRIQTQVNLNRATLETCTRDMGKVVGNIDSLRIHYNTLLDRMKQWEEYVSELRNEFVALRQEVASLRNNAPPPQSGERMDDKTLEILSANLATVSDKANQVDNLKISMELFKRRLGRIEEQGGFTPAQQREPSMHQQNQAAPPQAAPPQVAPPQVAPQAVPQAAPPQASPPTITHPQQEAHPPAAQYHPGHVEARHAHPVESEAAGSGWATVNQSKRPHVNGVETVHSGDTSPSKRPRLAPLEPRRAYENPRYDPARQDAEDQAHYHRTDSGEAYPEHANQSQYGQYHAEREAAHEDSRASASGPHYSPPVSNSPSGRGRGRGGRPRKQMIIDGQVATQGPDGIWYAVTADSSRRSSLAGIPPGPTMSPAAQQSPQITNQVVSQLPRDPYAHTKKTRTKPIRNADGVLIRKDGRPDMRSHSSAANLRKVHARKEEERRLEAQQQSQQQNSHHGDRDSELAAGSASSTPQPFAQRQQDDADEGSAPRNASTNGSAERVMRQMYPHGVNVEQRSYSRSEGSSTRSESSGSIHERENEVDGANGEDEEKQQVSRGKDQAEEESGSKKA